MRKSITILLVLFLITTFSYSQGNIHSIIEYITTEFSHYDGITPIENYNYEDFRVGYEDYGTGGYVEYTQYRTIKDFLDGVRYNDTTLTILNEVMYNSDIIYDEELVGNKEYTILLVIDSVIDGKVNNYFTEVLLYVENDKIEYIIPNLPVVECFGVDCLTD